MSLNRTRAEPDTFCYICNTSLYDDEYIKKVLYIGDEFEPEAWLCEDCFSIIEKHVNDKLKELGAVCKQCNADGIDMTNCFFDTTTGKTLSEYYKDMFDGNNIPNLYWNLCQDCAFKKGCELLTPIVRATENKLYKALSKKFPENFQDGILRFKRYPSLDERSGNKDGLDKEHHDK